MKDINLKIGGTLLIEDWEYNNGLRECESKIKIFDSDGKYLTYWETETIQQFADANLMSPKKWLENYRENLKNAKDIHELLELLGIYSYGFIKGKSNEAKEALVAELTASDAYSLDDIETLMNKPFDEIVSDYYEMINRIGDWIIVNWDDFI